MDPKAFIDFASSLAYQHDPSEAAIRTSIGRSYYGLYNLLSGFIRGCGFDLPKIAQAHKTVYFDLCECGIKGAREIAVSLDYLREDRNKADYELEFSDYTDNRPAVMSLLRARTAYQNFETLTSSGKKRKQLKKKITEYRSRVAGSS